ncbi:MAG TPA: hypothetical protein VGJ00_07925 [Rhabdochlamydiaceae bacterium]|jgi:hypothetical protein
MATGVTSNPDSPPTAVPPASQSNGFSIGCSLCTIAARTGVTGLIAWTFALNPLGAMLAISTASVSNKIFDWIQDQMQNNPAGCSMAKVAIWAITRFASLIIGTLIANAAGLSIGLGAVCLLNITTTAIVVGGFLCLSGVILSLLLACGCHGVLFDRCTNAFSNEISKNEVLGDFVNRLRQENATPLSRDS